MGSTEIRAKEATIQMKLDGQRLGGSMLTVKNFSLKSDADITKKRFIGDKRSRADLDVKGYDFSFKLEKRDHIWWTLWKKFELAELSGQPFPDFQISVTFAYRGGTGLTKTIVLHGDAVFKLSDDIPEGYQEVSVDGSCSYASGV